MKIKINAKTLIQGIVVVVINDRFPGVIQKKPKIINSPSILLIHLRYILSLVALKFYTLKYILCRHLKNDKD